jgi:STE24 endopeptidase
MLIDLMAAAAPPFDVDAATRAYLGTVQGAARAKSDAYFEGGYWLILWSAVVGIVSHWAMLRFGWSAAWRRWAERATKRRWLQPAVYAPFYVVLASLIVLPWTIYTGFLRERQYGLMNQGFGAWLGEQAIGLAVSIVATAIILTILFAVIRTAPRTWWLWGTGAMAVVLVFDFVAGPVLVAPLFNKYTPMPEGPLRTQILGMAQANHIPADNVYVFDASKQSKRISANVSGLGPTIRISLNDNLLNRSTPGEVKAAMGHEMGHYVIGHIWRLILAFTAMILAALLILWWLTPRLLARHGSRWGIEGVADPAVVPLFALVLTVLGLIATPLMNTIVRGEEIEADIFGLDAAREPDGFASISMKLSEYRKIEPGRLEEILFFDHPSGYNRVHRAMEWKARHLAELPPSQRAMVSPPAPAASEAR